MAFSASALAVAASNCLSLFFCAGNVNAHCYSIIYVHIPRWCMRLWDKRYNYATFLRYLSVVGSDATWQRFDWQTHFKGAARACDAYTGLLEAPKRTFINLIFQRCHTSCLLMMLLSLVLRLLPAHMALTCVVVDSVSVLLTHDGRPVLCSRVCAVICTPLG